MKWRVCIGVCVVAVLLSGCGTLDGLARWRLGTETAEQIKAEEYHELDEKAGRDPAADH